MLSNSMKNDIASAVELGASRLVAAMYHGCALEEISESAAEDPNFEEMLLHAEVTAEISSLGAIRAAIREGSKNWRAAVWLLERRYPDRYGRRLQTVSKEQANELCEDILKLADDEPGEIGSRPKPSVRKFSEIERMLKMDCRESEPAKATKPAPASTGAAPNASNEENAHVD